MDFVVGEKGDIAPTFSRDVSLWCGLLLPVAFLTNRQHLHPLPSSSSSSSPRRLVVSLQSNTLIDAAKVLGRHGEEGGRGPWGYDHDLGLHGRINH